MDIAIIKEYEVNILNRTKGEKTNNKETKKEVSDLADFKICKELKNDNVGITSFTISKCSLPIFNSKSSLYPSSVIADAEKAKYTENTRAKSTKI